MEFKYTTICENEICENSEQLTFEEYGEIKKEYGKYLFPSCREIRDNKNIKNGLEELLKDNAKITSEPKAEYTLDLHWLSQRNEELLKEIEELKKENQELKAHKRGCMEKFYHDEYERLSLINDMLLDDILKLRREKKENE